jgi:hypothetical protein
MTNFFNFAIGAIPLVKWVATQQFEIEVAVVALIYLVFAVRFGLVVFTDRAIETHSKSDS